MEMEVVHCAWLLTYIMLLLRLLEVNQRACSKLKTYPVLFLADFILEL